MAHLETSPENRTGLPVHFGGDGNFSLLKPASRRCNPMDISRESGVMLFQYACCLERLNALWGQLGTCAVCELHVCWPPSAPLFQQRWIIDRPGL
jgi:hypothetical protein